jgi:hypothetical protein
MKLNSVFLPLVWIYAMNSFDVEASKKALAEYIHMHSNLIETLRNATHKHQRTFPEIETAIAQIKGRIEKQKLLIAEYELLQLQYNFLDNISMEFANIMGEIQ